MHAGQKTDHNDYTDAHANTRDRDADTRLEHQAIRRVDTLQDLEMVDVLVVGVRRHSALVVERLR